MRALPLLLLLAACSGGSDKPVDDTGYEGCRGDPVIVVNSPADEATFAVGERVSFDAEVTSTAPDGVLQILWAIDGDVEVIGASGGWTPSAEGDFQITVQAEDSCGLSQQVIDVHVRGGGDTADTGDSGDTGDTGDTGVPPEEARVTTFGPELGLPTAGLAGLSVAPDGTVWAATADGLAHLDPATGAVRLYGTADGLYSDSPTAVLAASDGTVWVGHVGDVDRQGEQVSVGTDGALTVLRTIDYTESSEILAVMRLREQPYGPGAGDIWMGTNEGLCLYDTDVARFAEHAHPTHPHGYTEGVAFTADGDVWNGDAYQLSRWRYSNDGDLSPSADLAETVPTWPVQVEEPIAVDDVDADGSTLWIASELFGVARVDVSEAVGASVVDLFAEPTSARAVRADGAGNVWIGTATGLWRWDGATLAPFAAEWVPADGVAQIAVDPAAATPTVWFATSTGLVRVVGEPG